MKLSIGKIILILMLLMIAVSTVTAAPPGPPGPGGGGGGTYIGGSPIAGGFLILVALALGYGARKYYNARKRKISE